MDEKVLAYCQADVEATMALYERQEEWKDEQWYEKIDEFRIFVRFLTVGVFFLILWMVFVYG